MIKNNNPWINMAESSQRRVDSETVHNIFWITDLQGNYGFCIKTTNRFEKTETSVSLKGIGILKRNSQEGFGELFLILNKKEEWQIFKILCDDLIEQTHIHDTEDKMITGVELRLKRWHQLLKQEMHHDMTLESQMGLFSELLCLRDVIMSRKGKKQSIISWVGPESDKQDFLIDKAAVEVKSYRTSKSSVVTISSVKQLSSEKEFTYLISYGLTESDHGLSVADVALGIREILQTEHEEILQIFENKLVEYGFIPEIIKEPLYKFIVDKVRVYAVTKEFPRISQENIKSQILTVKYTIDLSQCREFETEKDLMIL